MKLHFFNPFIVLFSIGYSFKIGFQTSVNWSSDQTDSAFDEVPHVVGGHPQILAAGRPGRRGCGPRLRISCHDCRAEPGQRNDGHWKTAGLRGKQACFSQHSYFSYVKLALVNLSGLTKIRRKHILRLWPIIRLRDTTEAHIRDRSLGQRYVRLPRST